MKSLRWLWARVRALVVSLPSNGEPGRLLAEIKRKKARTNFLKFVQWTNTEYKADPVHVYLAARLQRFVEACERGESPRLMIKMPPQHGKSEQTSRRLGPYILGRNPKWNIGLMSYSAEWASSLSRDARDCLLSEEYQELWPTHELDSSSTAVDEWSIVRKAGGGGFKAVGRDGGITGRRINVLVVDDFLKNRKEADSATIRAEIWAGFAPNFRTRMAMGGGIIIVATQWHYAELMAMLEEQAKLDPDADQYEIINLEAIAPAGDPLGREEGEPLAPSLHDLADLRAIRASMSEMDWSALYCGRPTSEAGAVFRAEWFEGNQEDDAGAPGWIFQSVDSAYSEKRTADFTVIATWRVEATCYRLLHVHRERMAFPALKDCVVTMAEAHQPIAILVEDIGSGKSLAQELKAETRLPIIEWKPDRDKVSRANAVTPLFAAGKVKLPRSAPWKRDWVQEHLQFPAAAHDDQVDTTSMGLTWAREQEPKMAPTAQTTHDMEWDGDMGPRPDGRRSLDPVHLAEMAAFAAVAAIEQGDPVTCTAEQYRRSVRLALQVQAGHWIDDGQDIYAQIALSEVRRLDGEFERG